MKKSTIRIAASLLTLTLALSGGLSSCTQKEGDNSNPRIELQSYSYDAISEITESDSVPGDIAGAKYWRSTGSGVLPIKIGNRDITALRDTLMTLAAVDFDTKTGTIPRITEGLKLTDLNPDSIDACSYGAHYLQIVMINPKLAIWRCYNEYYLCHAAHGSHSTTYINYDIVSDKILDLPDIMKPDYEKPLTVLLRKTLSERDDLIVELNEIGIPREFEITPTGLRFLYGIYEIAPYSSGEITVDIPVYDLDGLLNAKGESFFQ